MRQCEICKKPYRSIPFFPRGLKYLSDCSCELDRETKGMEEAKVKKEKERIEKKIRGLMYGSGIDEMFLKSNFKVHNKELKPYCNMDWIGKKSLFVFGNYGCHKTGQVTAICKEVIKNFHSVKYWNTSRLARLDFKDLNEVIEDLEGVDLLVLDNFGKNVSTEDSRNIIFDLIDFRIHNYRSTIVITNELLEGKIDGALWDRFKMFEKIKISGDSKRGAK